MGPHFIREKGFAFRKGENMKRKKGESADKKTERKYAKPISLYPLKPEDVLSAFMKVDPKKIMLKERKARNSHK
jgi:hypothetical protein